uniref:RNA metabolism-related protein n=1 Tax=Paulinella micropora TaxID=1928728 RepID=A0A1L5YBV8_9EUKA|nr:hypothetical protein PCKR_399 [Paulinella micropora]
MSLPRDLLLSDLLRHQVISETGARGLGVQAWIHPSSHRVLGWVSRPSPLHTRYVVWRLNQLCSFTQQEVLVYGNGVEIDSVILQKLPTVINSSLVNYCNQRLGIVADITINLMTGGIDNYLVARSNPNIPGSSRWGMKAHLIVNQHGNQVFTEIQSLKDLPLIRSSIRQDLITRSRHLRTRIRMMNNQAKQRVESILYSWESGDLPRSPISSNSKIDEINIDNCRNHKRSSLDRQDYAANVGSINQTDDDFLLDEDPWI